MSLNFTVAAAAINNENGNHRLYNQNLQSIIDECMNAEGRWSILVSLASVEDAAHFMQGMTVLAGDWPNISYREAMDLARKKKPTPAEQALIDRLEARPIKRVYISTTVGLGPFSFEITLAGGSRPSWDDLKLWKADAIAALKSWKDKGFPAPTTAPADSASSTTTSSTTPENPF